MQVGAAAAPVGLASPASWTMPEFERPETVETSSADDFGSPLDAMLPSFLQVAWRTLTGVVLAGVDLLVPEEADTPDGATITAPLDRAQEAQRALVDEHATFGDQDRFTGEGLKVWGSEVWPVGQVLHGRIAIATQTGDWSRVDGLFRELESYRVDDGFVGGIGSHQRYYDDNSWIGLAAVQAYQGSGDEKYLRHAERTFRMVRTGQNDLGGSYWLEQHRVARHTCSVAPAGELAIQLYQATGKEQYLEFAKEQAAWLNRHLRLPTGLYADNLGDSGGLDPTIHSYNQGTPMGLDVQLYRATGEERYLARAKQTADASLRYFASEDRLFKSPPVFNAIFFRNLLALQAVAPDPRYLQAVDDYLERMWTQARDPETGLFDLGGVGHYEEAPGEVIDQGAISQLYAIRAMPPSSWASLA